MGHTSPPQNRQDCPWLIRRFIDPDAEIIYVAPEQVLATAAELDGRSFDAPGARFTHRDSKCTFEVLIDDFHLGDNPALVRLARIVGDKVKPDSGHPERRSNANWYRVF